MEWLGFHMRVTQVRWAEKTPEQRVTFRTGTELGYRPQSCLSETEVRPLRYESRSRGGVG